jgi:uncharacterized protein
MFLASGALSLLLLATPPVAAPRVERDVPVAMRDGVILRADVLRPAGHGPFPVLVYRTPYGKRWSQKGYTTFGRAVERGYAVVIQDVRGRFASSGEFVPYHNEGLDGFDTIEWAASQPWSNGNVGTFGLSYPGAVQWLAAIESPPHLKAMVPAMTFATPRNFFHSGGVFDLSWIKWIWNDIAPDTRVRKGLPGPRNDAEAEASWKKEGDRMQRHLPLADLPDLRDVAPYYYEWMSHPSEDIWWDWCELRGKYDRVRAAVLNLSGWYDEAYGPDGAFTNFMGLRETRRGDADPRTRLLVGPWVHGVGSTGVARAGDRAFGSVAAINYDETVLRFMDRYLRGLDNGVDREKPVRVFVMGENVWKESDTWPLPGTEPTSFFLSAGEGAARVGSLHHETAAARSGSLSFVADPADPVSDPFSERAGAHDYRAIPERPDVATFESLPLGADVRVVGSVRAEIFLSADAPDTDLWVKLYDVAPDGTAFNLMSPGLDVLRASLRDGNRREPLEPGHVYKLRLDGLLTGNLFKREHRIRVCLTTAFMPHFSHNLHTGESETASSAMRKAKITIHTGRDAPSRIVLPVAP